MSESNIGLVSYGLYLPAQYETAEEIAGRSGLSREEVRALGIERKCRPGPEDHPVTMAEKAAGMALERAETIHPNEVDVVIWTGEEYKDYIAQTAAIRVQEAIGCRKAFAYDLVGQGTTLILGLRVARDMMAGDRSIETVLLAGGTRNVDLVDYTRPDTRFLLSCSASGGAMILRRGHYRNRLGQTDYRVHPEMADEVFVPGGGTEIPFSPENLGREIMFYQAADPERLSKYLEEEWPLALETTIRQVLKERRVDYLALRHLHPAHRARILDTFGLETRRSASLNQWGHHGPNDAILSLDLGLKSGLIKDGSLVVMASGGIGFTYGAAVLEWGTIAL